MVRRWAVQPDMGIEVNGELVGVVSREAVVEAVLDGVSMGERAGGVVTVVWGRHRTSMDGEAVTTGLAVEWKSGPRAPAHPEAEVQAPGVLPLSEEAPEETPGQEAFDVDNVPVGTAEADLDEDLSAVPEALRT